MKAPYFAYLADASISTMGRILQPYSYRNSIKMSATSYVWLWITKRKAWFVGILLFVGFTFFLRDAERNYLPSVSSANQVPNQLDASGVCPSINWHEIRYCTINDNDMSAAGIPFDLSSGYLKSLGMPLRDFVPIGRENLDDFVLATAANKEYFHIAMDAIGNVQKFLPNHTIYFFDLDANRSEAHVNKIKSLCGVMYRKFNFSKYPPHVQYLKNYAFKPLLVHEMLSEFPRVFWIDSSIRFKTNNLSTTLDEVFSSGGILTFEESIHSNFEATHEQMYWFLPISAQAAAKTQQYGANSIYMHRTEEIYTRIIFWWVLCALREECMSPTHQLSCNFKGRDVWAGCHRFDQSALNILMANHFHQNVSRYTSRRGQLDVHRYSAHQEHLLVCPTGIKRKSAEYFL